LVMMLMAMSLAAIAPAITASPAFAAQTRCTVGSMGSPYWWGNKNAREVAGGTHVLAIRLPAGIGKDAFLWTFSGNENQKWVHKCVGYDSATGRNIWELRYAPNTTLCLTAVGTSPQEVLYLCEGETSQRWERVESAGYIALRNVGTGRCLQPTSGGTADGTAIRDETCTYSAAQMWY